MTIDLTGELPGLIYEKRDPVWYEEPPREPH